MKLGNCKPGMTVKIMGRSMRIKTVGTGCVTYETGHHSVLLDQEVEVLCDICGEFKFDIDFMSTCSGCVKEIVE